ncbi:MAG: methylmalonyl-CoA epimerase [Candidatus Thorarchaeota archaeon]
MAIEKLDHIGIAVKSIEDSLPYYRDVLGLEYLGSEVVEEQKVRVAFLKLGESSIELLEPISQESPIFKFLEKRGSGIHHLAVRTSSIEEALDAHKSSGARLIDDKARTGAHRMKIAFVHPKSTGGVLLELCEKPEQ